MRLVFVIFALSVFSVHGQKATQVDALLWTGLQAKLPITKKLAIGVETQSRFINNASLFKQAFGEIETEYEFDYGFSLSAIYRYSRTRKSNYFTNYNRFAIDGAYKFKTDFGLRIKVRARYQYTFDRFKTINDVFPDQKSLLRTAFNIKYKNDDFKRIQPFIGGELFFALFPKNISNELDTYRWKVGVDIDLPENIEASLFYMFEHENRDIDAKNHIYGVQMSYTFRRLNKKKKKKKKKSTEE